MIDDFSLMDFILEQLFHELEQKFIQVKSDLAVAESEREALEQAKTASGKQTT